MLICVIDASMCTCYCFRFCKLMINVEEVMYYACSTYKRIIRIISMNMCHIIQNFYSCGCSGHKQRKHCSTAKSHPSLSFLDFKVP